MKLLDKDGLTYYTGKVKNQLATKQSTIDSSHKLSSDLVDDTNKTNLFTNTSEKTAWNNKYDKPISGIPKTDLDSSVQTSLGKADTSIQTETDPLFSSSVASSITSSDITNWNNKIDASALTNYVQNTDYATQNVGGVVMVSPASGGSHIVNGILCGGVTNYTNYQSKDNYFLISKGTLENVITGKDLTTKAYVDGLVGDIATAIDEIQGEIV